MGGGACICNRPRVSAGRRVRDGARWESRHRHAHAGWLPGTRPRPCAGGRPGSRPSARARGPRRALCDVAVHLVARPRARAASMQDMYKDSGALVDVLGAMWARGRPGGQACDVWRHATQTCAASAPGPGPAQAHRRACRRCLGGLGPYAYAHAPVPATGGRAPSPRGRAQGAAVQGTWHGRWTTAAMHARMHAHVHMCTRAHGQGMVCWRG